jgi:hypothetical protein
MTGQECGVGPEGVEGRHERSIALVGGAEETVGLSVRSR